MKDNTHARQGERRHEGTLRPTRTRLGEAGVTWMRKPVCSSYSIMVPMNVPCPSKCLSTTSPSISR